MKSWKSKCRCGEPLEFSNYDVVTGRPALDADYWCSSGDPEKAPHDFGVVTDNGLVGAER